MEETANLSVSQRESPPWPRPTHIGQERLVRLHRSSAGTRALPSVLRRTFSGIAGRLTY